MFLVLSVIFGILLELVIIVWGLYFIKKKFYKKTNTNILKDISPKYKKKENEFYRRVYSSVPQDTLVNKSDGDLIPFNLSEKDKELLNMFYNED